MLRPSCPRFGVDGFGMIYLDAAVNVRIRDRLVLQAHDVSAQRRFRNSW